MSWKLSLSEAEQCVRLPPAGTKLADAINTEKEAWDMKLPCMKNFKPISSEFGNKVVRPIALNRMMT